MATIKTKFSEGDRIKHFTGVNGMVTAIFHRSGTNTYEMSYLDDGKPTCTNVQECEIFASDNDSIGFKRNTNGSTSNGNEKR